jgi:hypothetical protein
LRVKESQRARANPERNRARALQWAKDNPERNLARVHAWQAAHPEDRRVRTRLRKARLKCSCVAWRNCFFIREAYALARLRTEVTGIAWHVDHAVPLKSKLVCGLHVESNLRVITKAENLRKLNRVWPDMPS